MILFQLEMKVLIFDKIVFVMAPKINPAPAILTRKPYSLSVSSMHLSQTIVQVNQ